MPSPFHVLATQNPVKYEALSSETQLDGFIMRINWAIIFVENNHHGKTTVYIYRKICAVANCRTSLRLKR
jgi:hypothetical protein